MTDHRQRPRRGRPDSSSQPNAAGQVRKRGSGPTLARLIAVRVLERVERVRAYADLALNHALAQSNLASVDRALATELVYGTLRWRGRIDFALQAALDRPLAQVEPLVLTSLRIGAYQILFSDRIPDTAAVDEAVRCVRAIGSERSTGFVNAVLRRMSREARDLTYPDLESQPVECLIHSLSLPQWIAERWIADYGAPEAAALAWASNQPPPLTIRTQPLRNSREALLAAVRERFPEAAPCLRAPLGIVLGRRGSPTADPHFIAGDYTVQDEASQLVVEILAPRPGDFVLDTCAAPGTKTTAIAERLGADPEQQGSVLALDRNKRRLALIGRAVRRLGLTGVRTLVRDATKSLADLPGGALGAAPRAAGFDRVLVDAPCSGLGALRRNPDARWRVRPGDTRQLALVQANILTNAAEVLRPGGTLVYSTCTILREENEEVIDRFLASHPDFRLVDRDELLRELGPALDEVLDERGLMRCFPHLHDCDGFFAARLVRTE